MMSTGLAFHRTTVERYKQSEIQVQAAERQMVEEHNDKRNQF